MTEAQTYAWIFCAASLAAQREGATLREIEAVADGMNHAIPTPKEMSMSLSWAESNGLIERHGKKMELTDGGREFVAQFAEKPGGVRKKWDRITSAFEKMGADNLIDVDCRTMKAEQARGGNG